MKKIYLIFFLAVLCNFSFAQSTCRSAYDTNTNNVYSPTSYFPGPMSVPLNTDIYGTIDSGTDVDYYKFNITTSGSIRMSLSNLPANYNLRLVNSLGITLLTSSNSGTTSEVINFNVTGGTYYFALVYPSSKRTFNANTCYVLNIATVTATRMATDNSLHEPNEADKVAIYPNPTKEFLNIDLNGIESTVKVSIMNLLGEKVYEIESDEKNLHIDLSHLPFGLYILDVFTKVELISREKLIIK